MCRAGSNVLALGGELDDRNFGATASVCSGGEVHHDTTRAIHKPALRIKVLEQNDLALELELQSRGSRAGLLNLIRGSGVYGEKTTEAGGADVKSLQDTRMKHHESLVRAVQQYLTRQFLRGSP
jgi:hypothetical protein